MLRGVAQFGSARALGAWGRGFESLHPDQENTYPRFAQWPHGQAVKTSPFHGGNPGSIPGGVTIIFFEQGLLLFACGPLAQLVRAVGS